MPTDPLPQSGTFTPGTNPPPDSAAPPPPGSRPDQGPSAAPAAPVAPTPYSGPREPYLPLVRNRPLSQMGTDDWVTAGLRKYPGVPQGPWVPQPQDVNQLTHEISSGLGRIGSGIVGPMAIGLGSYRAAYLKAFIQGQEIRMRWAKEQHDMIAVQLEEQLQKEQAAIAEIVAYYKDKPKTSQEMWSKLREAAYGTRDKTLLQAINEQNYDGLERVMQARDGYHQSLAKLNEQRAKVAADQQKVKDAQDEIDADRKFRGVGQPQPQVQAPQVGAPTPPPDASTTPPGQPAPPQAASPEMKRAGEQKLLGVQKPAGVPQTAAAERDLEDYTAKLEDYMRNIQRDPNVPADQADPSVLGRIRAQSPGLADRVQGLLDGTEGMTEAGSVKPGFELAGQLAHKANPNFTRDQARRSATRERQENQARLSVMRPDAVRLQQNVSNLRQVIPRNVKDMDLLITLGRTANKSGIPVFQRYLNAVREGVEGDEDVVRFKTALEEFRRDVAQVTRSFGGNAQAFTVHAQRAMEDFINPGMTPGGLKAMGDTLKRDYENILVPAVDELNRIQHGMFGEKAETENADDLLATLRAGRAPLPPMPGNGRIVN